MISRIPCFSVDSFIICCSKTFVCKLLNGIEGWKQTKLKVEYSSKETRQIGQAFLFGCHVVIPPAPAVSVLVVMSLKMCLLFIVV